MLSLEKKEVGNEDPNVDYLIQRQRETSFLAPRTQFFAERMSKRMPGPQQGRGVPHFRSPFRGGVVDSVHRAAPAQRLTVAPHNSHLNTPVPETTLKAL